MSYHNKLNRALLFSWLIAMASVLGSLYFSVVLGDEPCVLCWYQRMIMFPLAFFLGLALIRNEFTIVPYLIPFTFIGLLIAVGQSIYQKVPAISDKVGTCGRVSCLEDPLNLFGWFTLPMASALAFIFILIPLLWINKKRKEILYL
ncbi:MAG: disulfide oxidoreductase [Bacilli bacterium]